MPLSSNYQVISLPQKAILSWVLETEQITKYIGKQGFLLSARHIFLSKDFSDYSLALNSMMVCSNEEVRFVTVAFLLPLVCSLEFWFRGCFYLIPACCNFLFFPSCATYPSICQSLQKGASTVIYKKSLDMMPCLRASSSSPFFSYRALMDVLTHSRALENQPRKKHL